jgi:hypothetical protein
MAKYDVINAVALCAYGDDGNTVKQTPIGIRLAGRELVMTDANYKKYIEAMGIGSKNWVGFLPGSGEVEFTAEIITKHKAVSAKSQDEMPLDPVWIVTPSGTNESAVKNFLKDKCNPSLTYSS